MLSIEKFRQAYRIFLMISWMLTFLFSYAVYKGTYFKNLESAVEQSFLSSKFERNHSQNAIQPLFNLEKNSVEKITAMLLFLSTLLLTFYSNVKDHNQLMTQAFVCSIVLVVTAITLLFTSWSAHLLVMSCVQIILYFCNFVAFEIFCTISSLKIQKELEQSLRKELTGSLNLFQLELATYQICKQYFNDFAFGFQEYNTVLHRVVNSKNAKAISELAPRVANHHHITREKASFTSLASVHRKSLFSWHKDKIPFSGKLKIVQNAQKLGSIKLEFTFEQWEKRYIRKLLMSLVKELTPHWKRVDNLAAQNLTDYFSIIEDTRVEVAARFLSPTTTKQFMRDLPFEENLKNATSTRQMDCAIIHLRMTGVLNELFPLSTSIIESLAHIYTDHDSFTIVVEKNDVIKNFSYCDTALCFAVMMMNELKNRHVTIPSLAIHCGKIQIGNFLSSKKISFNAAGKDLEFAKRLQEFSRAAKVKNLINKDFVFMSDSVTQNLEFYKNQNSSILNLKDHKLTLRGFNEIEKLQYFTMDQFLNLDTKYFKTKQAKIDQIAA